MKLRGIDMMVPTFLSSPSATAYITEKMILVADKLAAKDTENKQFLAGLFKYGTCFMGLVLVVGGTILGVNIKGTKLPSLARN